MFSLNKNILKLPLLILTLFLFSNCGKEEKKVEDMSFDELKQKTLSSLEVKQNDYAISYLERLISQHPENQNIAEYKLMLADLYFDTGNLPSAYQMYEHYTEFYPADSKAEYARYRSILSKFYQTLRVDCDQSDTQDTIKLCQNYLSNSLFSDYGDDIRDIRNTCERKLIDKEVYVYNFYLKKGKYKAAENRLAYIKDNYLEHNPALEARLVFLECKLAQKQKKDDVFDEKIQYLLDRYPESQFTRMAQGLNHKTKFIF